MPRDDMDNTVFDILIYVFDHYMLEELPATAERESIARELTSAGFGDANVERALDWLADLAEERSRPSMSDHTRALRVYNEAELARLPVDCRGLLYQLEHTGILNAHQREIVIDRLLALDVEELDIDKLKWVALMVLSSQPGEEAAYARMEDLVFDLPGTVPH